MSSDYAAAAAQFYAAYQGNQGQGSGGGGSVDASSLATSISGQWSGGATGAVNLGHTFGGSASGINWMLLAVAAAALYFLLQHQKG